MCGWCVIYKNKLNCTLNIFGAKSYLIINTGLLLYRLHKHLYTSALTMTFKQICPTLSTIIFLNIN